jgi:excisionase family DNA binding protein
MIQNKDVLKVEDLCRITGWSRSYIYKKTSNGEIPCYKPLGKTLFFKSSEIHEFLLRNKKWSRTDLEQKAIDAVHLNKKNH